MNWQTQNQQKGGVANALCSNMFIISDRGQNQLQVLLIYRNIVLYRHMDK